MTNLERAHRFQMARVELNRNGEETMTQVYEATGVSPSVLSTLENPESSRQPSTKNLIRLAQHYGVNAAWLAGQSASWSLNEDLRSVTDLTGLSPCAVEKLRLLMEDNVKRDTINSLIESEEFDQLISAVSVLSDYSGEAPVVEDTETVDYGRAIRKYAGGEKQLDFRLAEGDMRSYLSWKASRSLDALIGRMLIVRK